MRETWVRSLGREASPWRRKWQPTRVFLPRESHGWRILVGYSPRGRKESTWLSDFTFTFRKIHLCCIKKMRPRMWPAELSHLGRWAKATSEVATQQPKPGLWSELYGRHLGRWWLHRQLRNAKISEKANFLKMRQCPKVDRFDNVYRKANKTFWQTYVANLWRRVAKTPAGDV